VGGIAVIVGTIYSTHHFACSPPCSKALGQDTQAPTCIAISLTQNADDKTCCKVRVGNLYQWLRSDLLCHYSFSTRFFFAFVVVAFMPTKEAIAKVWAIEDKDDISPLETNAGCLFLWLIRFSLSSSQRVVLTK
jgi:hypothetical protein